MQDKREKSWAWNSYRGNLLKHPGAHQGFARLDTDTILILIKIIQNYQQNIKYTEVEFYLVCERNPNKLQIVKSWQIS